MIIKIHFFSKVFANMREYYNKYASTLQIWKSIIIYTFQLYKYSIMGQIFAENHESFDGNSKNFASHSRMNSANPTNFTTTLSDQVKAWNVGGKALKT